MRLFSLTSRGEKGQITSIFLHSRSKRREEQLCLSPLLRKGMELFHAVFTATQIPEQTPSFLTGRKEPLPHLPPSDKGLRPSQTRQLQVPNAPSVCPCAGPWSWPHSHCGHARALGLFRGIGCPVLRPPLLRFQAGRASPCSHRTVSRHEAGNRGHTGGHSSCSTIQQDTDFWCENQQGRQDGFRFLLL